MNGVRDSIFKDIAIVQIITEAINKDIPTLLGALPRCRLSHRFVPIKMEVILFDADRKNIKSDWPDACFRSIPV